MAHQDQVERAVVVIGREQPVEPEQGREQRADPQDRRADAGEQRQIRADPEGHDRDDQEEEQHPHERAAADAHGKPHVADEERAERLHGRARAASCPLPP